MKRCELIFGIAALAVMCAYCGIEPVGDAQVRLRGFIGEKENAFLQKRVFSVEARGDIFDEAENAFRTHLDSSPKKGGWWQGEYWGKTMLGYTGALRMGGDPTLKEFVVRRCRTLVDEFQRPDGAITTYADPKFVTGGWNLWGRKYTLWALIEAYDATGEKFMLEAAARMMDQQIAMMAELKTPLHETGGFLGMPSCSVLRPLLLLHERTGERRYLDYAREIVEAWEKSGGRNPGLVVNAFSDKFVHEWFPKPWEWAKAYEMMSCYEGLVAYSRITGEKRPGEAALRFAEKLVARELNALWSVGYYDHFEECVAYPNATSEICDVIHWNRLLGELFRATGDDRWLDLFEKSFLNAFLAGIYHREGWASHGVRSHGHGHQTCIHEIRMLYHSCCVDNGPRGFYDYAAYAAATDAEGAVLLNFYSDADIEAGGVKLSVSGNYPVSERITVKAKVAKPTRLRLRVPDWCEGMRTSVPAVRKGSRLEVALAAGETEFTVHFPMPPRILETKLVGTGCPDKVHVRFMFELRGPEMAGMARTTPAARVMRGPLLLCKAKAAGTRDAEVFSPLTVNGEAGWCAEVAPESPSGTWGRWWLTLRKDGEKREYPVCDYASAADTDNMRNSFSIWF